MALIRFSNLVNDIRGSSGGNTFSRGLAGATVSMKRTVSVPEGRAFRKKRSPVQHFTKRWRSLSEEDRAAWNNAAVGAIFKNRLGLIRAGSGMELFVRAMAFRFSLGLSTSGIFSTADNITASASTDAVYSVGTLRLTQRTFSKMLLPGATISWITSPFPLSQSSIPEKAFVKHGGASVILPALVDYAAPGFSVTMPSILTSVGSVFYLRQRFAYTNFTYPVFEQTLRVLIVA